MELIRATGESCASLRRSTPVLLASCLPRDQHGPNGCAYHRVQSGAFRCGLSKTDRGRRRVRRDGHLVFDRRSRECRRQARPSALVYEIGFPFAEKWEHFLAASSRPAFAGVPIVIATSASAEQCRRAGAVATLEILPRPTRDQVTAAIRDAWPGSESTSTPPDTTRTPFNT